ncbi:MAG: sugar transferase [Bacteroidia bacterium]|nr:sugar transferase [Bacteroidia bacterium]
MIKRCFDFVFSLIGLIILLPLFIIISLLVLLTSSGGVFFTQRRVGKEGKEFQLVKFRTMRPGSHRQGLLTVGSADPRITGIGRFLRKTKLDEFPQLWNVLAGDMSLVGPRPEVKKYTDLYTEEQRHVLSVRPGITDLASIEYANENDLLAASGDPEAYYIQQIMPAKLRISLDYLRRQSFFLDLKIILKTVIRILS